MAREKKYGACGTLVKEGLLDPSEGWEDSFMATYYTRVRTGINEFTFWKDLFGKYPEWEDLDLEKLDTFKTEYMKVNDRAKSEKVLTTIRRCVKGREDWYTENILEPSGFSMKDLRECLSVEDEVSDIVYLDEGDLYKLHTTGFSSYDLRYAKKIFMICCLTGARHDDATLLSSDNLDSKTGMLIYIPNRKREIIRVPVHPYLKKYLNQKFKKKFSAIAYAKYIKKVCEIAGINQRVLAMIDGKKTEEFKSRLVSPDSGRASFANNVYKRGGDVYEIARILCVPLPQLLKKFIVERRGMDRITRSFFKEKA